MNAIKAAQEFGVKAKIFPGFDLTEIKAMGLANAAGTLYVAYWNPNLNDKAHAFFKEFVKRTGKPVGGFPDRHLFRGALLSARGQGDAFDRPEERCWRRCAT